MTVSTTETTGVVVPPVSGETMAQFAAMAVLIPEAVDEDAYEQIVTQILSANGIDELNAPWDTDQAEALNGHRLKIEEIQRRASDFEQGLGLFLVIKGIDMGSGAKFVTTTGAIAIVAQLARAYFLNGFPVIAEWVIADKPTKKGYRPQHMKIIGFGGSK